MMDDIDTLGLKALKELITSAGLSFEDCIDKADLRARAREALEKKKSQPAAASSTPPQRPTRQERTLGSYPCLVQGPPELLAGEAAAPPADLLMVVLHGLGASNSDLADVPSHLVSADARLGSKRVVAVFPQAPPSPLGNAWWQFNVQDFIGTQMMPQGPAKEAMMARLIRQKPPGLDECRAKMATLLEEARALAGGAAGSLPPSKLVLAGFSLGASTASRFEWCDLCCCCYCCCRYHYSRSPVRTAMGQSPRWTLRCKWRRCAREQHGLFLLP